MNIEDITPQMRVAYVPKHDPAAKEPGTVSFVGEKYVFVRFDAQVVKLGWDNTTSKACDAADLVAI